MSETASRDARARGDDVPEDDADFYGDAFIRDPWPHYARLRALGPVVRLTRLGNYAIPRYAEAREALRDHALLQSGQGVAGDDFGCSFLQGNTVASDPPRHTALRAAMAPPLKPEPLQRIAPEIQRAADALIDALVERGSFDAIGDLARHLPLTIVRDQVGLPDFGKENMLKWAAAAFDVLGVQNARGCAARAEIEEMRAFITAHATPDALKPGSWTRRVIELAENGALDPTLAPFAVRDYINPSLDTTISAIGQLIWRLGRDPAAWARLRRDPDLLENAAHEAVRLGTPIRSFSRHLSADAEIGGTPLPKGARVMILFASANRDERMFVDPDRFDVARRNARRHLGFGAGIHMCVGMHLAILEMTALLRAMTARVKRIDVGAPTVAMNNTICALATLPTTFERR